MILGGLRDKNFKFRCIYVPTRLDILPVTQHEQPEESDLFSFFSPDFTIFNISLSFNCLVHIARRVLTCWSPFLPRNDLFCLDLSLNYSKMYFINSFFIFKILFSQKSCFRGPSDALKSEKIRLSRNSTKNF